MASRAIVHLPFLTKMLVGVSPNPGVWSAIISVESENSPKRDRMKKRKVRKDDLRKSSKKERCGCQTRLGIITWKYNIFDINMALFEHKQPLLGG